MKNESVFIKDVLSVCPDEKTIFIEGQRMLIFDAVSIGILRKEITEVFGELGARNILTRFGFTHGQRTANMLKTGKSPILSSLEGGAIHHMLFGIAYTVEMIREETFNGRFIIRSTVKNSFEAQQYILNSGISKETVCWAMTAFASGYETAKNNSEFYFIETECIGKGDRFCVIEGRFREDWDCQTLKEILPFYGIASQTFQQRGNNIKSRTFDKLIVRSKKMQTMIDLTRKAAHVNTGVLITGESGAGKEVTAKLVHEFSDRASKPFVAVNCGALSETLLETELFGHAKGAFTGAHTCHEGLFECADGGTLFLDEIGEISPAMQVKLLRVLQEKEIMRVGETRSRKINVRIIAATNRDLAAETEKGNFRNDLYYRLKVIEIIVPPLRERTEDILPLAYHFLKLAAQEMHTNITGISSDAAKQLIRYRWPGNVRELQNAIERAAALCTGNRITICDLPEELWHPFGAQTDCLNVAPLCQMEKEYILTVLDICGHNIKETAEKLNIGTSTLYKKLKEYGIS
ncbi:sigma 54-interacting transcriptional regulator [Sphaerochaeta sp.]|uniref:sigma 54-interacting transcriptional regulator n=1 Tax=Sphaerochaeta sp. TaxID=1972642 RepID=UPI003D0A5977